MVLPRLRPSIVVVLAAATILGVFAAARRAARAWLGPTGFHWVITQPDGSVRRGTSAYAIAPEVVPSPQPGGSLVLSTTLLVDHDARYSLYLGSSTHAELVVDGRTVFQPPPGLVRAVEQQLGAGPHAVVVRMPKADREGTIAFAIRPPGEEWRARLVDAGDTTRLSPDEFRARVGSHFAAYRTAVRLAPYGAVCLIVVVALALVGRRRLVEEGRAYSADAGVRRTLTLLAFGVIVVPMVSPLFAPGFYFCHEGEGYAIRLAQYAASLRAGVPMGRWWPDPVLGRGYPFLCLYAPLLYLIATPFLLAGLAAITVVKIVTAVALVGGAGATFALVRRRASRAAALLATALFTYAPYVQTNFWVRADLAECLGFPTFLVAILVLDIVLDGSDSRFLVRFPAIALLAVAVAALGCSHNITAYSSLYFIAAWMLVRIARRDVDKRAITDALLGGALGALLTVFYALPALFDSKRVWIERVMTGFYDPIRNLLPWSTLISASPRWGMRTFVGLPAALVCIAAVAVLLLRRVRPTRVELAPERTTLVVQGVVGTLLALLLASRPIGLLFIRHVPLANFVQFPFRMLLFAACLAPLAAAAVDVIRAPRARLVVSGGVVAVVMAAALPVYGPSAPLVRVHTRERAFLRELDTDYVTSMNEYLPRTVRRHVPPFGDVAHVVAGSAALSDLRVTPGRYTAVVDAPAAAVIEFNAHWFPGWIAEVDGKRQPIGPDGAARLDEGGLIRVATSPGHHVVVLTFTRTPLRAVCDALSLVVLVVLAAVAVLGLRRRRRAARTP